MYLVIPAVEYARCFFGEDISALAAACLIVSTNTTDWDKVEAPGPWRNMHAGAYPHNPGQPKIVGRKVSSEHPSQSAAVVNLVSLFDFFFLCFYCAALLMTERRFLIRPHLGLRPRL